MINFKNIHEIPNDLLVYNFLKVAYPTKNLKRNYLEEFERVLDVTGSKFLTDKELQNRENERKIRMGRIESSIPKGMYLSDYPEDHFVWAEIQSMRESRDDDFYISQAPRFQELFFNSFDNDDFKIQMLKFTQNIPVVSKLNIDGKEIQLVAFGGKVFEIEGENTTDYYSVEQDKEIVDEIIDNIQKRIDEQEGGTQGENV